jgi:outer membrane protein assembly factor BamB
LGTVVDVLRQDTGALVRQQPNLYGGIQAIGPAGILYSCSYQTVTATNMLGQTLWQSHIPSTSFFEKLAVDAAGKVYCTTEENELYAYSPSGAQLWQMLLPAAGAQNLWPVIGPDGSVYVQDGNFLVAIGGNVPAPGTGAAMMLLVGLHTARRRR